MLDNHPIFKAEPSDAELSENTLHKFTDTASNGGRHQIMVLRDVDLIVAVGPEIRMASLNRIQVDRNTADKFTTLKTPAIQFDIRHISLNPTGKFLAVADSHQVAVVPLPGSELTRLNPKVIDCKAFLVGQFYHAAGLSTPIAKIDWHPWGASGSSLMVMTVDGKLREYDIAEDPEEPQQILSFIPERKPGKSYIAEDPTEREVASFTLGKGRGDWGPLTVYAITKSGDIYSICPYLPQNAAIPSSYVHALECFIAAKQEFLSSDDASSKNLTTLYDHQHKYVASLVKQLPTGTVFPAVSRTVVMHPPKTFKSRPARQGPFLLQPSPRSLTGSDAGNATDITYLNFGNADGSDPNEGVHHLGIVLVAYQDGRIDVCLDVEKVEARWEHKSNSLKDLPMLAVYETVDLGLVTSLITLTVTPSGAPMLDLLQGNFPAFLVDSVHDDTVYVYHAFGVHALDLGPILRSLASALGADDEGADVQLDSAIRAAAQSAVSPMLSTFSIERRCSNPVFGIAVPDDVYLPYGLFVLTSAMRVSTFALTLRSEPEVSSSNPNSTHDEADHSITSLDSGPPPYVSLLTESPYTVPAILAKGITYPRLALPPSKEKTLLLTSDTLRYLQSTVKQLVAQIHEYELAKISTHSRAELQLQELKRMCLKCRELQLLLSTLLGPASEKLAARLRTSQSLQKSQLQRLDRVLQAMMDHVSPGLSESETKWFEELKRLKDEVAGHGKYDEGSLVARAAVMEREYMRIVPNLKKLAEKEQDHRSTEASKNSSLGFSQAFEFGERSNQERLRISQLTEDISKLAVSVDVNLSRPPG